MRSHAKHVEIFLKWTTHLVALPMAQTSQIEGRLSAVLQKDRSRSVMTRKAWAMAGAVAAGILVPLAALRPVARAQAEASNFPRPQAGTDTPISRSPRQLAAVREFRTHLQGWALSHRTLLRRLNDRSSDDRQTLQALYECLPSLPLYASDPRFGSPGGGMPRLASETPGFSPRHLIRSHDPDARRIQQEFVRYHDLKLASTVGVGSDRFSVWVSGRITRTHSLGVFQGHGRPILLEDAETTLAPPFGFLRR